MKITISFKHLEHTPALDDRIKEKSERFRKYMNGKTELKWTCYVKSNVHYAECSMIGPHFEYFSCGSSDTLYKSLDLAIEKLEKQILKKKDKLKNKIHRNVGKDGIVCLEPDDAWSDYEEEEEGYAPNFYKDVI